MAFTGSNFLGEVGLRLLLCPLDSHVVVRTACCSVGIALPVYSTFKAVERKDPDAQQKCLVYWAAYGSFAIAEVVTDKLIYWFPYYYHMKFAFLVWLQLPPTYGATKLYMNYLRPFLLRHQAKLDYFGGFLYCETNEFVHANQAGYRLLKKMIASIIAAANQVMREALRPNHKDSGRDINGPTEQENNNSQSVSRSPTEQEEDSNSEHED